MKKNRFEEFRPTLVLVIICLVVTAALTFTYGATKPVIENIRVKEENAARRAVLPEANDFKDATANYIDKDHPNVISIFEADGGKGYVVSVGEKGFGGVIEVLVGLDSGGAITRIKVLSHAETPGLGTKAMAPGYLDQYSSATDIKTDKLNTTRADATEIDTITGATITSNALYHAVDAAIAFYKEIKA
jgi:electron transport complex protein RnfG